MVMQLGPSSPPPPCTGDAVCARPVPLLESLRRPAAVVDRAGCVHRANWAFATLARGRPVLVRGVAWSDLFACAAPFSTLAIHDVPRRLAADVRFWDGASGRLDLDLVRWGLVAHPRWLVQVMQTIRQDP